jgi:hypothetical protein
MGSPIPSVPTVQAAPAGPAAPAQLFDSSTIFADDTQQITSMCGCCSGSHLSRSLKDAFERPPSTFRPKPTRRIRRGARENFEPPPPALSGQTR